jgi:hypothetical protein
MREDSNLCTHILENHKWHRHYDELLGKLHNLHVSGLDRHASVLLSLWVATQI